MLFAQLATPPIKSNGIYIMVFPPILVVFPPIWFWGCCKQHVTERPNNAYAAQQTNTLWVPNFHFTRIRHVLCSFYGSFSLFHRLLFSTLQQSLPVSRYDVASLPCTFRSLFLVPFIFVWVLSFLSVSISSSYPIFLTSRSDQSRLVADPVRPC